jgi:hypothetical protein
MLSYSAATIVREIVGLMASAGPREQVNVKVMVFNATFNSIAVISWRVQSRCSVRLYLKLFV